MTKSFILVCAIFVLFFSVPIYASENTENTYHIVTSGGYEFDLLLNQDMFEYQYFTLGFDYPTYFLVCSDVPLVYDNCELKLTDESKYCKYYLYNYGPYFGLSFAEENANGSPSGSVISKNDEYEEGKLWSNYNLKNNNGSIMANADLNFHLPLTLEQAVRRGMKKAIPRIMRTFSTLAVCGIGFLALLASLPILKKVLCKFLLN